jgi:hypothetical protein
LIANAGGGYVAHREAVNNATGADLGYGHSNLQSQPDATAHPNLAESQVKSRKRVVDHGEVFTGKREVNAMLDLVADETKRIDSRFLEPACGGGNFLTEVLARKLRVVKDRYGKSQLEYERYAVSAVSSIYGIDVLEDNVEECRNRLLEIFDQEYTSQFRGRTKVRCYEAVTFILKRNIIWADALSLKTVGEDPQPIVFSEWTFPFHDSRIKRRDFRFSELVPAAPPTRRTQDLFSKGELVSDIGGRVFIPDEIHSESPVSFLRIGEGHE